MKGGWNILNKKKGEKCFILFYFTHAWLLRMFPHKVRLPKVV